LDSLADRPGFAGSERRIEPKDLTRKFRLRSSGPYLDPCS
jgi:hypothetical protein